MKFNPIARMRILAILPVQEDRAVLSHVFTRPKWELQFIRTFDEARRALQEGRVAVVLSECSLPDGHDWRELLEGTQNIPNPPPLIVTDQFASECLWAEVLNLGGYDLLMKPFDEAEVFRVVSLACLAWQQQSGFQPEQGSRAAR